MMRKYCSAAVGPLNQPYGPRHRPCPGADLPEREQLHRGPDPENFDYDLCTQVRLREAVRGSLVGVVPAAVAQRNRAVPAGGGRRAKELSFRLCAGACDTTYPAPCGLPYTCAVLQWIWDQLLGEMCVETVANATLEDGARVRCCCLPRPPPACPAHAGTDFGAPALAQTAFNCADPLPAATLFCVELTALRCVVVVSRRWRAGRRPGMAPTTGATGT